jgi:uncharacterized protein YwgA
MNSLPRCWPILYILEKNDEVRGHFYLQKYIYLAKVEGIVPIDYEFIKDDYGPYSVSIKADAFQLDRLGFIEMLGTDGKWIFRITEKGRQMVQEIMKKIKTNDKKSFDEILEKFSSYSLYELKNHVYKGHIRSEDENERLKSQLMIDIMDLISFFRSVESSNNSLLARGSLDYCSIALRKEQLKDKVKKDFLLGSISSYLEEVVKMNQLVRDDSHLLKQLNLEYLREKFDLLQELISKELKILPRLDDDDIDLDLFLEDENEKPVNSILTSTL